MDPQAVDLPRVRNFHVWIDINSNARRSLPSADDLAGYDVIVTSINRLTREQKKEGERSVLRQALGDELL